MQKTAKIVDQPDGFQRLLDRIMTHRIGVLKELDSDGRRAAEAIRLLVERIEKTGGVWPALRSIENLVALESATFTIGHLRNIEEAFRLIKEAGPDKSDDSLRLYGRSELLMFLSIAPDDMVDKWLENFLKAAHMSPREAEDWLFGEGVFLPEGKQRFRPPAYHQ